MSRFFSQKNYVESLEIISSLSRLFSESSAPFLHYRVMENLFCTCFDAQNLSRSDTAYDAKIDTLGIGLKTFLCPKDSSLEKIAEFNKDSNTLKNIQDSRDLAEKLATLRNARMQLANDLYGIESSLYHIIARRENELVFFESDYDKINISNLQNIKHSKSSLIFSDGQNEYFFNHSKSVLQRKFKIPKDFCSLNIKIVENPFEMLLLLKDRILSAEQIKPKIAGVDFVILPLYSTKGVKNVPTKSGLNQWNASGRERNFDEVYIPVPKEIHNLYPHFFPARDEPFVLQTPLGENLSAKLCQDNAKALMSNPNSALANWLLRKILKLKQGELATLETLENLGFDSVVVEKQESLQGEKVYRIDIMPLDSYQKFIESKNVENDISVEKR